MFDFKEKFKERPTIELLQMLDHPEKYQPDAIEAARTIIKYRKETNPELFEKESFTLLKEDKHQAITNKPVKPVEETIDIWKDDEIDRSNKIKTRNHILSVLCVYVIINVIFLFSMVREGIYNNFENIQLMELVPTLGQFAFAVTGIIFFLKREKTGWILLVFDFTFRTIFLLQLLTLYIKNASNPYISFPFYNTIVPLILFGLVLFRLGSLRLMTTYKATKQTFIYTMVASIIFAACIVFAKRFI